MFGKEKKPAREERVAEKVRAAVAVQLQNNDGQIARALETREKRFKVMRATMEGDRDAFARFTDPSGKADAHQADAVLANFERALRSIWATAAQEVQAEDDKAELDRIAAAARAKAEADMKEQRRQEYLRRKAEDAEFENEPVPSAEA
jgi:hypothetical protein